MGKATDKGSYPKGTNPPHKKASRLTPKEREFCRQYVLTRNGAEAVRRSYNVSNPDGGTPRVMANQLMRKEHIRNEIELLMWKAGLDISDVVQVHKRNMMQGKDIATSQRAVSDYYKVTGRMDQKEKTDVKVAFIIEDDSKKD